MQIEIDKAVLKKMCQLGVIAPSEVRCLDESSKLDLKDLCIELCKPENCRYCDAMPYCQYSESSHGHVSHIAVSTLKQKTRPK